MNIEIANRLVELRKQKGLSQEDLANKLGVSRQAVSKWECGEASPDTDNLITLSKLYEVSLDELVGNKIQKDNNKEDVKKDRIEIDGKNITVYDDEGQSINIKNHKKHHEDNDEDDDDKYSKKQHLAIDLTWASAFLIVLGTYIGLGLAYNLWHPWWIIFFLPEVITSVLRTIFSKNANKFSIIFLILFVYFLLSFVIVKSFAYTWILFFAIPIYYTFVNAFKRYKSSN